MKCIIPAAGFGTRLKEISSNTPKALLKIKNKTILDFLIEKIIEVPEINEIKIVTNAKFYSNFLEWKRSSKYNLLINIINNGIIKNEDRLGQ